MCQSELALELGLSEVHSGEILWKKTLGSPAEIEVSYSADIKRAAALLYECGMDFDSIGFLSEVSHALRHGIGVLETAVIDGKLCACAVSVDVSGDSALINGIAVKKEYRRAGLGMEIMKAMEEKLGGRNLFVFKDKGINDGFYQKAGYGRHGMWSVAKL